MGKTTKYILIGLGVIVLAIIIFKMVSGPKKTQVAVEKAMVRNIVEKVSASGKIKPHVEVKISAEVSGEIVDLPIKEGDVVKKGQLLCRIRPDILKSGYERAVASFNSQRASVGNSEQMLKQSEAAFNNQASSFKRSKELYDKKVITAAEFETARANYESAKASLEAARQSVIGAKFGLEQSQASVKEAGDNLAKTSIYSPVDGVVSKLSVEKGERVLGTIQMAGTELMTISDLSDMDVNVDVNENDINRISVGDASDIEIDAFLGKKFTGHVIEIGSSANVVGTNADQVTNFTVKVRIDAASYTSLMKKDGANPSPFRPGLTATVEIKTNQVKALAVPIQSVTTRIEGQNKKADGGDDAGSGDDDKVQISQPIKEFVFVIENGKAKQVPVKTGIQDDAYIQVLSGVKAGTEVVSAPYSAISKTLKDGEEVEKVDKSKLFNGDNK